LYEKYGFEKSDTGDLPRIDLTGKSGVQDLPQ